MIVPSAVPRNDSGMNTRWFLLLAFLGCAPVDPAEDTAAESTESDLTTNGRGLVATTDGYYSDPSNVARELDAAGAANVPGVLTAVHSTSPYMFAAQVELVAWSSVSAESNGLMVRIEGKPTSRQGKAAKAVYDALNLPAIAENGAQVKRTPRGTVACFDYGQYVQCALGSLGHVRAK